MVSLLLKLYIGIYRFFWRLFLFVFVAPFSKTYRRYAIAYYQPLWWALKLVFSNLAVLLLTCFLLDHNIILGVFFVVGVIVYKIQKKRKCRLAVSHSNSGFTLLELLITMSVSMLFVMGTIGFVRGINAQKNTNKIVKEIESIQNACIEMAIETTSFTIDDLVSKGLITTKRSFVGNDYSVVSDGKILTISLTLPSKNSGLIKEFAAPITYSSLTNQITANYVLPRGHRSIADKHWYGF